VNLFKLTHSDTLVLSHSAREVTKFLELNTAPINRKAYSNSGPSYLFNGWVRKNKFCLSRKINRPDNFLPLIQGSIDETSLGSILFINYRLFPSTLYFLLFWSVLTCMIAVFFLVIHNMLVYGLVSLGLGVVNYLITFAKFHRETKKTRSLLQDFFNQPHKYTITE